MQVRRVAGRRFREPTHLRDVPLGRLIEYSKFEPEFIVAYESAKGGEIYENLKLVQRSIKAISLISGIPEETIKTIRNPLDRHFNLYGEFAQLFHYYFQFFRKLEYRQNLESAKGFKKFSFMARDGKFRKKHTFHLFRLQNVTTKQYLFFSEFMTRFMDQTVEEIRADLSQLPKLIACIAWKKKELEFHIGEVDKLTDKKYQKFGQIIESRQQLFEQMPSSLAYRCLDYFFLNCRHWPLTTRTSSTERNSKEVRRKNSTLETMLWSRLSTRLPSTGKI